MVSQELIQIIQRVEALTPDEQMRLIVYLAGKAQQRYHTPGLCRQWRDICGAAPYPLLEEDAQAWVSRTRREGDEQRASQWRRSS